MKVIKSSIGKQGTPLFIKALLAGTITAFTFELILMCLLSILLLISGTIPHSALRYIIVGVSSLSVFAGGYITARVTKSSGLLWGALCGFIFFLISTIPGMVKTADTLSLLTLLKIVAFIISGALGGIKAVNKKEKLHIR